MRVTATFIVRNEIARIAAAIYEIKPYVDEVLVCDQESDDGTFEKAREHADRVISDKRHGFCEASRVLICDAVRTEWILSIDADEMLTSSFAPKLREIIQHPQYDGYGLLRQTIQWRPETGTHNSIDFHHFRLWKKGTANLPTMIHCNASPIDPSRSMDIPETSILHLKTWAEQEADNERYWNECGQPRPS